MKETTFLPYDVFKTLTKTQLEGQSLYEVFANDFNQQIHYADEEFSASILTPEEAEVWMWTRTALVYGLCEPH